MATHGFFEISAGIEGDRLERLLGSAYRSSRDLPVFLWLRGVDRDQADALLDPVVAELGVEYSGVEFLVECDEPRARRLADSAAFQVVASGP